MNCPSCNSDVSDDKQFCGNCGGSMIQPTKTTEEAISSYCKNCGVKVSEGASFCSKCGTAIGIEAKPHLRMAGWGQRFVAWLIDMIILGFVLGPWIRLPGIAWAPEFLRWIPFVDFGMKNLIHFLYWMFMETYYGQSLGKMVMKIKLTKLDGRSVDIGYAAIQSVGKAFLLPLDCILGWIFYSTNRQRLFNYLSDTIVVNV